MTMAPGGGSSSSSFLTKPEPVRSGRTTRQSSSVFEVEQDGEQAAGQRRSRSPPGCGPSDIMLFILDDVTQASIQPDLDVLGRLLYRSRAQHRRQPIYTRLLRVYKLLGRNIATTEKGTMMNKMKTIMAPTQLQRGETEIVASKNLRGTTSSEDPDPDSAPATPADGDEQELHDYRQIMLARQKTRLKTAIFTAVRALSNQIAHTFFLPYCTTCLALMASLFDKLGLNISAVNEDSRRFNRLGAGTMSSTSISTKTSSTRGAVRPGAAGGSISFLRDKAQRLKNAAALDEAERSKKRAPNEDKREDLHTSTQKLKSSSVAIDTTCKRETNKISHKKENTVRQGDVVDLQRNIMNKRSNKKVVNIFRRWQMTTEEATSGRDRRAEKDGLVDKAASTTPRGKNVICPADHHVRVRDATGPSRDAEGISWGSGRRGEVVAPTSASGTTSGLVHPGPREAGKSGAEHENNSHHHDTSAKVVELQMKPQSACLSDSDEGEAVHHPVFLSPHEAEISAGGSKKAGFLTTAERTGMNQEVVDHRSHHRLQPLGGCSDDEGEPVPEDQTMLGGKGLKMREPGCTTISSSSSSSTPPLQAVNFTIDTVGDEDLSSRVLKKRTLNPKVGLSTAAAQCASSPFRAQDQKKEKHQQGAASGSVAIISNTGMGVSGSKSSKKKMKKKNLKASISVPVENTSYRDPRGGETFENETGVVDISTSKMKSRSDSTVGAGKKKAKLPKKTRKTAAAGKQVKKSVKKLREALGDGKK
ncbi:unnamed protein product [Amoebophrya sp. A120]|nr:unnamed protein product [Amoebophrya sp. A120]|eukprot:GSA120T00024739001.1